MKPVVAGLSMALLLVVFVVVDEIVTALPFAAPQLTDLSSFQAKQIEIYIEMNKQLLTLASFVFAGVGFYLSLLFKDGISAGSDRPGGPLTFSVIMAAFSIYMGYLSYDKMVWMLSKNVASLDLPLLYWLRTLQFWSFAVSILLFGYFWLTLSKTRSREGAHQ